MNSERNSKALRETKSTLVGYLLLGYPEKNAFLELVKRCDESALDIFEIGLPSNSPYADGEVIRKAHQTVDSGLAEDIGYFQAVRNLTTKPIWLMAYYDEFIKSKSYLVFAKNAIVDAFVIPDMTFEQRCLLRDEMEPYHIDVLGFSNPEMTDEELHSYFENFPIVYEQLYIGRTGKQGSSEEYMHMLEVSKQYPNLARFAGFGISSKDKSKKLLQEGFDGVIIGTELVNRLNKSMENMVQFINEVGDEIKADERANL